MSVGGQILYGFVWAREYGCACMKTVGIFLPYFLPCFFSLLMNLKLINWPGWLVTCRDPPVSTSHPHPNSSILHWVCRSKPWCSPSYMYAVDPHGFLEDILLTEPSPESLPPTHTKMDFKHPSILYSNIITTFEVVFPTLHKNSLLLHSRSKILTHV